MLRWALMNRAVRRMEHVNESLLLKRTNRQCEALGILTFPDFRAGEMAAVPVTFGWRNPTVILPADWRDWPLDKLDLVLAHELSHIQRRDYLLRIVSTLNKALYWFHPLSRWLERRLTQLGEELSDDAALGAVGSERQRYVDIIEDFAGSLGRASSRFQLGIAMSAPAAGCRRIARQRALCSKLSMRQKLAVFWCRYSGARSGRGCQTTNVPAPHAPTHNPNSPHPHRVPAPMFSRACTDALRGILVQERDRLSRAIEALQGSSKRRGRPPKTGASDTTTTIAPARKKRIFTAAQHKRQADRMKRYWAEKKKAKSA